MEANLLARPLSGGGLEAEETDPPQGVGSSSAERVESYEAEEGREGRRLAGMLMKEEEEEEAEGVA